MKKRIKVKKGDSSNFHKVDLHIHTPWSNCYKGPKDEEEYIKILRCARDQNIRAIAFTDHNSIGGYKKLSQIKEALNNSRIKLLADAPKDIAAEMKIIEDKLKLFEQVVVLPGVEFEVKNGIHLLVIFNPLSTTIDEIEMFLQQGGYDRSSVGYEEPTVLSKWDVLELYEQSSKFDCIVIDAHTDSNKGLLNTLPPGRYRANCLTNSLLKGICYKSETQKDKLNSTFRNNHEYFRDSPVAFLKFSDAHEVADVGSQFTWFKAETISFMDIKKALLNPDEYISIEYPSVKKILDELIKKKNSFGIEDLSEANKILFKKMICALNNSEGGYCLIGLSENKNKIGLEIRPSELKTEKAIVEEYVKNVFECFSSLDDGDNRIWPVFNTYPLQKNRFVFSLRIDKSDKFISPKDDGRIYSLQSGKLQVLSAGAVQKIVEQRQMQVMERRFDKRLDEIESECRKMRNVFNSYPILNSFEEKSIKLSRIVQAKPMKSMELNRTLMLKLESFYAKEPNGKSRGTITIVKEVLAPRLPYAYLRYSLPLFYLKLNCKIPLKECLYIFPGGAVFYSKKEYPVYSDKSLLAVKCELASHDQYSVKFVASFLKSSFWLWYAKNKFDSVDLFLPEIYHAARIPKINKEQQKTQKLLTSISEAHDKIMELENVFLMTAEQKNIEAVESHNLIVSKYAYQIDMAVYDILGLSELEKTVIEEYVRSESFFLPDS